jgi:predicted membrane-bound spermidine synthase
MTVEVSLLQRLSVFLGHPIYSLSVVLFSLILTTGLGSLLSDLLPLDKSGKFIIWSLLTGVYLTALPFWLPNLLLSWDHANLLQRAALCVAVITPAGLLMGFGFPTGMRLVSALDPNPTPWFWGINGVAGVLAAGTTVAISIAWGTNVALVLGGLCYILLIPPALGIGFRGTGEVVAGT